MTVCVDMSDEAYLEYLQGCLDAVYRRRQSYRDCGQKEPPAVTQDLEKYRFLVWSTACSIRKGEYILKEVME